MIHRSRAAVLVTLLALLAVVVPGGGALGQPSEEREPAGGRGTADAPRYVEGELLVRFAPGAPESARADVRERHELEKVRDLPLSGLELVRARGGDSASERAQRVRSERAVRYAHPNHLWYPADTVPTDPEFDQLWGLHNTGQATGYPPPGASGTLDADIDGPEAWDLTDSSGQAEDIVVAVIDTGVQIDHPDLTDTIWTNPGETPDNGIDDDGNGFVDDVHGWDFHHDDASVFDDTDPDGHGTHVAGTIAAEWDNGEGVAGVSQATIMPLKFLGPQGGSTADAIDAIDYAIEMGADLSNNSWGGGSFDTSLRDKIGEAGAAGQLFVAAAGNAGADLDTSDAYPCSYDVDNIVCVAATDRNDGLASFSNRGGEDVDLGAPGADIYSTVPRFAKAVLVDNDSAGVGYHAAYHTFGLEGARDAADAEALMSAALGGWMGLATSASILLVDDDAGASYETAYQDALSDAGFTNVTTTVVGSSSNGPSADTMDDHDVVIWQTGATFEDTLTSTDQTQLTDYLTERTGELLLFGRDIDCDLVDWPSDCGSGPDPNAFLHDVLKAHVVHDLDQNFRPVGQTDTPYAGLGTIELREGTGTGQTFSGALTPLTGGVAGLRGAGYAWFNGTSMATPHVSGAAAQLIAALPSIGHLDVKARLMDGGDPLSALDGETVSGKRLNLLGSLGPPTVQLTAPSDGAELTGTVTVTADASDVDGSVTEVVFLVDGAEVSRDTASPYRFEWDTTGVVDGAHTLTARAVDDDGFSTTSDPVEVTADNTAPTVSITAPSDGEAVSGTVNVAADASDAVGVAEVVFLVDGAEEQTDTSAPYTFDWDTSGLADGTVHELRARARDDIGHETTSAPVNVTVDNTVPTVSITTPSDGDLLSGTVNVSADASDAVGVAEMVFLVDGDVKHTDTSSPYLFGWDTRTVADGSHTLTVRAVDDAGNASTSDPVEVTADNAAPTVSIAAPDDGDLLSGTVAVSADASDAVGVAEVVFLVDGVEEHADTSAPYTFDWDTSGLADGSHTLTARAVDLAGHTSGSSPTDVTVDNVVGVKALGGESALASSTLDDVSALTGEPTSRLAGADRYETAAAIVADAFPGTVDTVYVATGADFPDALAGSAAAAEVGAPVLLVARDAVPDPIATELQRLAPRTVKVLGGSAAVSDATLDAIEDLSGATVRRIAGADRYTTAAAVVADAFPGTVGTVYVATGADFPDALAGSAAAARLGAPVILVARDAVPSAAADQLRRLDPSQVRVLGGVAAVSDATADEIGDITGARVRRLAGADRFATAAAIVADAFPEAATLAYLATGVTFPDALAGSAAAGRAGAPVLLATRDAVPDPIAVELERLFGGP